MTKMIMYCIIFCVISCTKKTEDILPPVKMQAVFWDVIRADVYNSDYQTDSTKQLLKENVTLQKKIFQLHGVTREQFYKSFEYYTEHPDKMTMILDSMMVQEDRRRNKMIKQN